MKPDPRFLNQPKRFWASVRLISQKVGYTARGTGQILVPDLQAISRTFEELDLDVDQVVQPSGLPTDLGRNLVSYYAYRAKILNGHVQSHLMDAKDAAREFKRIRHKTRSKLPVPMNKQKGAKKRPAYLTAIVSMLIEANLGGLPCDYDPRKLTTFTHQRVPLRTLARRIDGAFPSTLNPIAVWEIKEYYHTTTFGSRVADGVYETLLDGMEIEDLRLAEGVDCGHYLMIDSHYTWWECGRSYLCRIVDMLHMGYVTEVLFGTEVFQRLPNLAREWVGLHRARSSTPC